MIVEFTEKRPKQRIWIWVTGKGKHAQINIKNFDSYDRLYEYQTLEFIKKEPYDFLEKYKLALEEYEKRINEPDDDD